MADEFNQPLKVIFNSDGSIKTLIVGTSIQQGDHLSKQIFVSVNGISRNDYTSSCEFVLPNGEISELAGTFDGMYIGDEYYYGYKFILTEAQTLYAGNVKANIKIINLQEEIICSYQINLKINPTGYNPNETHITEAQYNSLLQSLNSYMLKEEGKKYRHSLVFSYHGNPNLIYYGTVEIISSFSLNIALTDLGRETALNGSYVAVLAAMSLSSFFDGPAVLFQTRDNQTPYIIKNGVPYNVDGIIRDTVVEI